MNLTYKDPPIHKLKNFSDVWSVVKEMALSGLQEDAFYICDIGDVVRKYEIWKKALPRVEPFYAIKCNDCIAVIKTLAALGSKFDCASQGEIKKVLSLGVDPDRIIFANPTKPLSHITYAKDMGVRTMTFDSEAELRKTSRLHPNARLVIRIRCDSDEASYKMGQKFGCDHKTEAPRLLKMAKEFELDVVGVCFHVGSGSLLKNPLIYRTAIGYCYEVFQVAKAIGYHFNLLDIGGGFLGFRSTSLDNVASVVNLALDEYFPGRSVDVIAEPGQFFVASAFTLAVNIHSIRTVTRKNEETENEKNGGSLNVHYMYYLNQGMYGAFFDVFYEKMKLYPKCLDDYKEKTEQLFSSSLWGVSLDSADQIVQELLLPHLSIGDWLVFEDRGAYTLTISMEFNSFPLPKLYIVADENMWSLLREKKPFYREQFITESITMTLKENKNSTNNSIKPLTQKDEDTEDGHLLANLSAVILIK